MKDYMNEEEYTLIGVDGNAYYVMGYVRKCMREVGMTEKQIDDYSEDARSGDYNHLLCVSIDMVAKCNRWKKGDYDDEWE